MQSLTLLDVINAVSEHAQTPDELKAVVTHLVNSGKVKLRGELAGCKIEFGPVPTPGPVVNSQTTLPQQTLDQAG